MTVDGIILTIETGDGKTHQASFSVDDWDARIAAGDIDAYLELRAYPKIREKWGPDFTVTDRQVVRGITIPDPEPERST